MPLLGTHPVEMGMAGREGELVARLAKDDCYQTMFRKAFRETHGAITFPAVAKALAAFERTLVTYGSAYDHGQLSPEAQAGGTFFVRDCAGCHAGPNFTDLTYHGLAAEEPTEDDPGLSETSDQAGDRGKFRTPSLRNVTLTGPWWHDGTAHTISDAIARHGFTYAPDDQARLLAFLGTLADTDFTTRPELSLPDRACGKRL